MDFEPKKLSREAGVDLHAVPFSEVKAYGLLFVPAYVYLPRNEKFVSVKGPLDFFLPAELTKLSNFENLYFARNFLDFSPFLEAGRRVRALLLKNPAHELKDPPFVVSDAVIRTLGPLWRNTPDHQSVRVDPLPVCALANEICEAFTPELLTRARDQDVHLFDTALLRSSWAVFAALHLGHLDLQFLSRLRDRVLHTSLHGFTPDAGAANGRDIERLAQFSFDTAFDGALSGTDTFQGRVFSEHPSPQTSVMQKMESRLRRIQALASA